MSTLQRDANLLNFVPSPNLRGYQGFSKAQLKAEQEFEMEVLDQDLSDCGVPSASTHWAGS